MKDNPHAHHHELEANANTRAMPMDNHGRGNLDDGNQLLKSTGVVLVTDPDAVEMKDNPHAHNHELETNANTRAMPMDNHGGGNLAAGNQAEEPTEVVLMNDPSEVPVLHEYKGGEVHIGGSKASTRVPRGRTLHHNGQRPEQQRQPVGRLEKMTRWTTRAPPRPQDAHGDTNGEEANGNGGREQRHPHPLHPPSP